MKWDVFMKCFLLQWENDGCLEEKQLWEWGCELN